MKFTVQLGLIIGILWLGSLLFLTITFSLVSDMGLASFPDLKQISENLNKGGYQTSELKRYMKDLRDILQLHLKKDDNPDITFHLENVEERVREVEKRAIRSKQYSEPNRDHELIRRKTENGVIELWYYMTAQLNKLKKELDESHKKTVENILDSGSHQQRSILTDIYNLSRYDGFQSWREEEARDLRNLVQRRLYFLQNPSNCSEAKQIVCDLRIRCGFGCQVHHVAYCMIVAYATGRTLILESKGWTYARRGWETVFQPLSESCNVKNDENAILWHSNPEHQRFREAQVVRLRNPLLPKPHFVPLAIPEDISERLIRLHGDPCVWWMGQIMTFIMRPHKEFLSELEQAKKRLGFDNPIVGVHVRRTDKVGTEAAFHAIEEYMVHVENYYQTLMRREPVPTKRVYLATDDDSLLSEAKRKYPDFQFISDNNISKSASVNSRYSEQGLKGIITDIYFLSRCDFLVCTFSSRICRVSYELMQNFHHDASSYFHSLDDIYFFAGQNDHNLIAIYPHEPQNSEEIELKPGDKIHVLGNHWDGYSKGINKRVGKQSGLYPSYKVENKVEIAKMPLYKEADKVAL